MILCRRVTVLAGLTIMFLVYGTIALDGVAYVLALMTGGVAIARHGMGRRV